MKTSFKKLILLVFHRERKEITEMLQNLGVVHIEVDDQMRNEDIEGLEQRKNNLIKAIEAIKEHGGDHKPEGIKKKESVEKVVNRVLDLKHRFEENLLKRENLRKERLQRLPWGDFDPENIQQLTSHGLNVSFCITGKKEYRAFDFGTLSHQVIYESADQVYFVVVSREEVSLPFESVKIPDHKISEITDIERRIRKENKKIKGEFAELTPHISTIRRELIKVENELSFALTQGSFREYGEGSILSLTGWFPVGMGDKLEEYLKKEKLTYSFEDPEPGSKVPILLKNRKYSKLFEPITRIFELPNYYELDLTPLIAVFYPVMFAYCLGDAGYGLVFLLISLAGWFTFLKHERRLAVLGVILGLFTTVMGIIKSGSVFGMPTSLNDSWIIFQYLRQYIIVPDDRTFIFNAFNVSLMIGVVQIFTGITLSIVNKLRYEGSVEALPQVGKLMIVSGLIWTFLADMQGVEILQPLPILRRMMIISGVLLVLFFHDMSLSIISRAASGLLPLFFIITGILGDVLSYVRLFALGVASSVLGLVVNQIGGQIMENGWWGILIGVTFLLFGHTLNFFIAILGAFVHPLRLTFVEFYNNAQFKGGGSEYRPFRKESLDMNN